MLEKLYPQFLYSLQPSLSKQEFIYFLNTSKGEFWEFRREFIEIRLNEANVDQFIHDEGFRSFLQQRINNPSKQLSITCSSSQIESLFSFQFSFSNITIFDNVTEDTSSSPQVSSDLLLRMNNFTTSLDLSPCRWEDEHLLEHLFSSLIDLTLENANSLIVFPFLPSLKKVAIYVAKNLLDVKALSHVKDVYLSFCSSLKGISCLRNVHNLWLDSFNSEININDLANVYELTLTNISFIKTDSPSLVNNHSNSKSNSNNHIVTLTYSYGFTDYARFINATHVTLNCFESTHSIDFTLFKNATLIDLTNFELISADSNFLERCKELKNLKTLKFRDIPNLRSIFLCISLLPSIHSLELSEVQNCDDLFDLSSLGSIPYLNISEWKNLRTLRGLGTGNKCVCLTDIPNVKNMLPLISVPKVQLGQHDLSVQCLIQLTNVQHLELSYCNLSDLTPLRHGRVTTLVLYEFDQLRCLDGAENIPNVFIDSCFSLTDISCLLNGKNRKFCLWDKIEQLDFAFLSEEGEYLLEENCRFGDRFYAYSFLRKKSETIHRKSEIISQTEINLAKKRLYEICEKIDDPTQVKEFFDQYPSLLNEGLDCDGNTALILASEYNRLQIVKLLLSCPGIDVGKGAFSQSWHHNECKTLALHSACRKGHIDIAKLILSHDAYDVNFQDECGWSALHEACNHGHADIVRLLLSQDTIDVNITEDDVEVGTALHLACSHGHVDVVRLLLSHDDIDVNIEDGSVGTPLHKACSDGHADVVRLLLSHNDVDVNIQTEGRRRKGWTALHWACNRGHADVVRSLLSQPNIDIRIKSKDGKTACDIARHQEIEDILQNYDRNKTSV